MEKKEVIFFLIVLVFCVAMYGLFGRVSVTLVMASADKSKPGVHFVYLGASETEGRETEGRETEGVTRETLSCRLKNKVPFSTITRTLAPLQAHPMIKSLFPKQSLEDVVHYNSCAVVSSSHAMKFHNYGRDIDAHDAVVRFNCAPTKNYVTHVGRRTDIRLINTVIPYTSCQRERVKMFNNEIVVVRNFLNVRVGKHGKLDLHQDQHHSFGNYVKYRRTFPERTMHFIQRPNFGVDIKNELSHFCNGKTNCKTTESEKSPSTGAHGIVMMLHLCDWVYTYEFVPSAVDRNTSLAHYFDEETNFSWLYHSYNTERDYWRTLTVTPLDERGNTQQRNYHSYNTERDYWRTLTVTSLEEVEKTGVAVFRGLSQYNSLGGRGKISDETETAAVPGIACHLLQLMGGVIEGVVELFSGEMQQTPCVKPRGLLKPSSCKRKGTEESSEFDIPGAALFARTPRAGVGTTVRNRRSE
ncbi:beta-galactoside alpha-2,6-sialyltransferase [Branchiostoma belcheri]|nr:beta-galactoside alpha-2,6-sialyltransferase [Branchiostoma belcheri]